MTALPRVRPGLQRHQLDEQVLVYDQLNDQVHLLDPTTACVLELLEAGQSLDQMTGELSKRHNLPSDTGLVELAIDELRRADLLMEVTNRHLDADVTRRDLVRKLAMVGAAAAFIPAVATLTATRGYAQGSVPGGPCAFCTTNAQCISGTCNRSGSCEGGNGNDPNKLPNGSPCNGNGLCCSNNCDGGVCVQGTR